MNKQHKILIVEDDPDTAEMLSAYFEAQGYSVQTAVSGNDVLAACNEFVPDLIIQDIRLPDIDAYEVVRDLRKNLRTSKVPIIFLTEKKERQDRIAGLELGAVDYLTKPFDMQELRLRVRNVLRRASYSNLVSPITGLPGREVVEERLQELVSQDNWLVVYLSLVGLDAFDEAYGLVAGDDVLRAASLILGNVMDESGLPDDFCGHTSKTSFLLVTRQAKAAEIRDRLGARLDRAFNYFYPIKDIKAGSITAPMRAEVGIVSAADGPFGNPTEILNAAIAARKTVAAAQIR